MVLRPQVAHFLERTTITFIAEDDSQTINRVIEKSGQAIGSIARQVRATPALLGIS